MSPVLMSIFSLLLLRNGCLFCEAWSPVQFVTVAGPPCGPCHYSLKLGPGHVLIPLVGLTDGWKTVWYEGSEQGPCRGTMPPLWTGPVSPQLLWGWPHQLL